MARIVQQGVITTSGTSYENEPIIKSDGAGEVMQWLASTGSSKITIDEDSSNAMSISVPTMTVGSLDIGHGAGGETNTAVGTDALDSSHASATDNTAIGNNALTGTHTAAAVKNTAVGSGAGAAITTGSKNTFVGNSAGDATDTGDFNTAVGEGALGTDCVDNNTAVGRLALYNFTGSNATAIGSSAGKTLTTASDCTMLGHTTAASAVDGANQTVIGASATGQADNSVVLGNASVTAIYAAQDSGATVHCGGLASSGAVTMQTSPSIATRLPKVS